MAKNTKKNIPLLQFILSVLIFGTIGICRRGIAFPSGMIAMSRGYIGVLFLVGYMLLSKKKPDFFAIRKNMAVLAVSGAMIGCNWILLFEAYNYTTVATATLCYYFSPVFVLCLSPFLLHEKLSPKKVICIFLSLIGMVFVSGITEVGVSFSAEIRGVLFGIGAAVLYASIVILNKKVKDVSSYDKTVIQLLAAAIVVTPYVILKENVDFAHADTKSIILLIVVGIIHTGLAYTLYFGAVGNMPAQSVAVLSYIDPAVAILLSALVLREPFTLSTGIGAVLILGTSAVCEISFPLKKKK